MEIEIVQRLGAWVTQSVELLTLAQAMISRSMSLSPTSGSEPALDSVSPSLSAAAPPQM